MKHSRYIKTNFLSALVAAAIPLNSVFAATDYKVETLQDSLTGWPTAINSNGTVSGVVFGLDSYVAAYWDANGSINYIPPEYYESVPYDINDNAQIALYHGALGRGVWQNGNFTPFDLSSISANVYGPDKINNAGTAIGTGYFYVNSTYQRHAFSITNNVITDLGVLPGATQSWSTEINNNGDIVGYSYTPDNFARAVLWRNNTITNLGTLPGQTSSYAYAINDNGRVAGNSGGHLFTWENGMMTDLGTIVSGAVMTPHAINKSGDIVGEYNNGGNTASRAFLWSGGAFTDLTSIAGGCTAVGINDAGQIAVGCPTSTGVVYRLTPSDPSVDLGVTSTSPVSSVTLGQSFSYVVTVTNYGSLTASNVSLTDTLPSGVSFVSMTTSQGSCNGTSVLNCNLNSIASGAQATVQITVMPTVTGYPRNTASVTTSDIENNTTNNSASNSVQVIAPAADISVSMSASARTIKRNSNLTYTATVTNNGPASASNVKLTDTIPSGMSFVSATTTVGSCSGTSTVSCDLGTMASGVNTTVKITVKALSSGFYVNTANVTSSATDSNLNNNTVQVTTTVK